MRSTAINWQIARVAQVRVVTGNLSDEEVASFLARLASIAPGMALQIEVDTDMAKAAVKTKARREPEKVTTRMGRPAPLIPKQKRSVYLDTQIWEKLGALQRKNADPSLSVTLNRLLRQALSLDVTA